MTEPDEYDDPTCLLCGAYADWEECTECGGTGELEDALDALDYLPGDEVCAECHGRGGIQWCSPDCSKNGR